MWNVVAVGIISLLIRGCFMGGRAGLCPDLAQGVGCQAGGWGKKNPPSDILSLAGELGSQRPESGAPVQAAPADFLFTNRPRCNAGLCRPLRMAVLVSRSPSIPDGTLQLGLQPR